MGSRKKQREEELKGMFGMLQGSMDKMVLASLKFTAKTLWNSRLKPSHLTEAFAYICNLPDDKDCMWRRVNLFHIVNLACNDCVYRRTIEERQYREFLEIVMKQMAKAEYDVQLRHASID